MIGLLFDSDEVVGSWLFANYGLKPLKFDRAIGLVNQDNKQIGAILFHNWNGTNVELSYFGKNTTSPGILRCIARFAIYVFDPARVTVVTSKRNRHLMRSLQKFGFKVEGAQRCYYGKRDSIRNTGVRFVMFRPRIDELAKLNTTDKAA